MMMNSQYLLSPIVLCLTTIGVTAQQEPSKATVEAPVTLAHESDDSMAMRVDPTDAQITDAIDDELRSDPAVIATRIDTMTADGIVTLTGSVNNLLAKQRAARLAMAVRGVKAVVNRVSVQESGRSNQAIRYDVSDALLLDPATDSYSIHAEVSGGQDVTLFGDVQSYAEKRLAGLVASGVRGVRSLDNQLEVNYKQERTDPEIQNDIEGKLDWNRFIDGALVTMHTKGGNVSFRGVVGSATEKHELERAAWVVGVKSVDVSKVGVERWARDPDLRGNKYAHKPDAALQQAVAATLRQDPRVLSFHVQTDVEHGAVTLRGTVDNLKAKRAAAQNAENCVGVWHVDNRLKVRTATPIDDAVTTAAIERALLRDPWVEGFDITVNVKDGTASLYGVVDTMFDRARADDVAARVSGVESVRNLLTAVDYTTYGYYDPRVDWWYSPSNLAWYDLHMPWVSRQSDPDIRADICNKLWWSPFVDDDQIDVQVSDGCAMLTGTVESVPELMSAVEKAYEGGAIRVVSKLTVGGDTQ